MTTVHAAIGNSDDKLSQVDWSNYVEAFQRVMIAAATQAYGQWYSEPRSPFQNACMAIEIKQGAIDDLKSKLLDLRLRFGQDSIALNVSDTEFV